MMTEVPYALPPLSALTIAVVDEPGGTKAFIRADFAMHPSILMEVRAHGARTVVRGGKA
jgi:uncharacterized protein GlcG (DUF336 family)